MTCGGTALHTRQEFNFFVQAPLDVAWPLFGAEGERSWAPGWAPRFIWPREPADREGMVFAIAHELGTAIWVNTAFDQPAGRVQYAYVLPEIVVTVISLHLLPVGEATRVEVIYERTALSESANDRVKDMAEKDQAAGVEWCQQIDRYLQRASG